METRTCKVCGETKRFARGTWVWTVKRGAFGNTCLACSCQKVMQRAKDNKEAYNAKHAEWRSKNREKVAERNKNWAIKNQERHAAIKRRASLKYRLTHPDKMVEARKVNYITLVAHMRKRQAAKLQRTPKWFSDDDRKSIEAKYAMAKWLSEVVGVPYHVDHILPLRGKLVSGLHIADNTCVITANENLSKGNKWAP